MTHAASELTFWLLGASRWCHLTGMKRLRVGLAPRRVRLFSVSARHGAVMEIAALGRCVDALTSAIRLRFALAGRVANARVELDCEPTAQADAPPTDWPESSLLDAARPSRKASDRDPGAQVTSVLTDRPSGPHSLRWVTPPRKILVVAKPDDAATLDAARRLTECVATVSPP